MTRPEEDADERASIAEMVQLLPLDLVCAPVQLKPPNRPDAELRMRDKTIGLE